MSKSICSALGNTLEIRNTTRQYVNVCDRELSSYYQVMVVVVWVVVVVV